MDPLHCSHCPLSFGKGSSVALAILMLCSVGLFWLTSVGGSLAYQLTRPIPTSLAIIHSRVYAQALTLAALGMAGLVDVYEHRHQTNEVATCSFLHPLFQSSNALLDIMPAVTWGLD